MTPGGPPYCGEELLPHATARDGTPAPIVCTSEPHSQYVMHRNDELKTEWRWQDADGNWLSLRSHRLPGVTAPEGEPGYSGTRMRT